MLLEESYTYSPRFKLATYRITTLSTSRAQHSCADNEFRRETVTWRSLPLSISRIIRHTHRSELLITFPMRNSLEIDHRFLFTKFCFYYASYGRSTEKKGRKKKRKLSVYVFRAAFGFIGIFGHSLSDDGEQRLA